MYGEKKKVLKAEFLNEDTACPSDYLLNEYILSFEEKR